MYLSIFMYVRRAEVMHMSLAFIIIASRLPGFNQDTPIGFDFLKWNDNNFTAKYSVEWISCGAVCVIASRVVESRQRKDLRHFHWQENSHHVDFSVWALYFHLVTVSYTRVRYCTIPALQLYINFSASKVHLLHDEFDSCLITVVFLTYIYVIP